MKIVTASSKKRRDTTIIIVLLLGLPVVVFAALQVIKWFSKASMEAVPENVLVSNLGTASVTISWVTENSSVGSVVPIVNSEERAPVLDKRGGEKRKTHYVELSNLEPNTDYNFAIISDGTKYTTENNETLRFKTASIDSQLPVVNPIHGNVEGVSGDDVILYATLRDSSAYPVSTIIPKGGNWIMDLSSLRNTSDKSLVSVNSSSKIAIIAIVGENKGAVTEGSYSELFDSNGKLKDIYQLNISERSDIYSYFTTDTLLEREVPPVISPTFLEEEEIVEKESPRFRLVIQIPWEDIVNANQRSGGTDISNIDIVNVTDTNFSVIWTSRNKEEGFIRYGRSTSELTEEAKDERDGFSSKGEYLAHMISTSRLVPDTQYFFEIISGGKEYNNNGEMYSVKTFPTLSSPPPFDSVAGEVEGLSTGNEAILSVFIQDKDELGSSGKSTRVATLVDELGRWILPISDSRAENGLSYFEYTSKDILNMDVVTSSFSGTHSESMEDITNREISIQLQGSSVLGTEDSVVGFLDNYGILGYTSGKFRGEIELLEDNYEVQQGTQQGTPKTGIFDSKYFISVFVLGLFLVAVILLVYILKGRKKKINMKDTL